MDCIVCGFAKRFPVFNPGSQTLAALGLPKSADEALAATQMTAEYVACASCGHIYNPHFDVSVIPYQNDSNRMYNAGKGWQDYIQWAVETLANSYIQPGETVIEVGSGNGEFLSRLKKAKPGANFIGFEPGIDAEPSRALGLDVRKDYFIAERDFAALSPGMLIMRHMVEHLPDPGAFIAEIAYHASLSGKAHTLVIEVPSIEVAIKKRRFTDYLYEHVSNFTRTSLKRLVEQHGYKVKALHDVYNDEVLLLVATFKPRKVETKIKKQMEAYHGAIEKNLKGLRKEIDRLAKQKRRVAFWGGTGKSAAFLAALKVDAARFPIVVDSDERKWGFHVPGLGQKLISPETLIANPVQDIVITTNWRAGDIIAEITRRGIKCERVLVPEGNKLKETSR